MSKYSYNFTDFVDYLSSNSQKEIRVCNEIVWDGNKPIPKEIVKDVFYNGREFFEIFEQHMVASFCIALSDVENSSSLIKNLPSTKFVDRNKTIILTAVQSVTKCPEYKRFHEHLKSLTGTKCEDISNEQIFKCLTHDGKKYERLYYNDRTRFWFRDNAPNLLKLLPRKNGDFFGNIICEKLEIYRSGYSDALAKFFNRLLDFKSEVFPLHDPDMVNQGRIGAAKQMVLGNVIFRKNRDGSLWEPFLDQNGKISIYLDNTHPSLSEKNTNNLFHELLLAMAREEMHTMNENKKQNLEEFRYRVSRCLSETIPSVVL